MARIVAGLPAGAVKVGDPVANVMRDGAGVTVDTLGGHSERLDAVVVATHADDALGLLRDADSAGRAALRRFEYTTNEVVLHTDARMLPRRAAAQASWNVVTADCTRPGEAMTMDYDMSRLQSLPGPDRFCVSVNPDDRISPERVIVARPFSTPLYTLYTLCAHVALRALQGRRRTYYAGAYLGYGFHEDGCRSGYEAAELLIAAARIASSRNRRAAGSSWPIEWLSRGTCETALGPTTHDATTHDASVVMMGAAGRTPLAGCGRSASGPDR